MIAPDNPQAFPVRDAASYQAHGMTLRDYFAGQALTGFCANPEVAKGLLDPARVASLFAAISGEVADAMLAERAKAHP